MAKIMCPKCKRETNLRMLFKGKLYCLVCYAELCEPDPDWRYAIQEADNE